MNPHPGGPFIEQATAAPGEERAVPYTVRCWKSINDDTMTRCHLRIGHDGRCMAPSSIRDITAAEVLPQHSFLGRLDRWCELCNRPDRDPIHIVGAPDGE